MTGLQTAKPPRWFWAVAALAVAWAVAGCLAYVNQVGMSDEELASLPRAQHEIWSMMPDWVTATYAVAVWGSLAASIALVGRRASARPLYIIALLAVIVQFGWVFLATPIIRTVGPSAIPFPALILLLASASAWFAGTATLRGWLR